MDERQHPRYDAALAYLAGFTNFEKKMPELYAPEKMDPARQGRLLAALGQPQDRFPSLHIAGTKGKGSTAAMTAFALRAAGLRVGLYTSPHLIEVRERVRVLTIGDADGRISRDAFADALESMKPVVDRFPGLTWFEIMTALALRHFARERVDVAVVEVGLGGRLDATNVLRPLVSAITRISYDHTALLGDNLADIAGEKGGIIKPEVPVVTAPQHADALARLEAIAREQAAPLTLIGRDVLYRVRQLQPLQLQLHDAAAPGSLIDGLAVDVPLAGAHQAENAAVAAAMLRLAATKLPDMDAAALAAGIGETVWPGRFQLLRAPDAAGPGILLDGAHNGESAERLADTVRALYPDRPLHLLLAFTEDKELAAILRPLLPLAHRVVATATNHPRAADAHGVAAAITELGTNVVTAASPASGLLSLWELAAPGDLILATGSLFLVGDLLNQWERLKSETQPLRAGSLPGNHHARE
jgi:dihydrofolate synthase/folylpolyglutamate synthase